MKKLQKEFLRKGIHSSTLFILPFYKAFGLTVSGVFIITGIVFYVLLERVRLKGKKVFFLTTLIALVQRKEEGKGVIMAPIYLALGIGLSFLFEYQAALVGILAVTIGDSVASLVGSHWKTWKIPGMGGRSIGGSLACFAILAILYVIVLPLWPIALVLALVACLLELSPVPYDNLVLSVGVAFTSHLLHGII